MNGEAPIGADRTLSHPAWPRRPDLAAPGDGDQVAAAEPDLSVVILTRDRFQTIRKTIRHLRAQTVRDRMEIVIVAPSRNGLDLDVSELEGFLAFQVVEVGELRSLGEARAAAVHAAAAPVVAFGENHSFPEPGWAQALLDAHRGPWAAVGPAIVNANPASATSRATVLMDYGRWMGLLPGERDGLAWHNSSYKREALLSLAEDLAPLLEVESLLHAVLRRRGQRLYLEPRARTRHMNLSRVSQLVPAAFQAGRFFATGQRRHHHWSRPRRVLQAGAGLLALPLRVLRVLRESRRVDGSGKELARLLPLLVVYAAAHLAGEAAGYLTGPGTCERYRIRCECDRGSFLNARDRRALEEEAPPPMAPTKELHEAPTPHTIGD